MKKTYGSEGFYSVLQASLPKGKRDMTNLLMNIAHKNNAMNVVRFKPKCLCGFRNKHIFFPNIVESLWIEYKNKKSDKPTAFCLYTSFPANDLFEKYKEFFPQIEEIEDITCANQKDKYGYFIEINDNHDVINLNRFCYSVIIDSANSTYENK